MAKDETLSLFCTTIPIAWEIYIQRYSMMLCTIFSPRANLMNHTKQRRQGHWHGCCLGQLRPSQTLSFFVHCVVLPSSHPEQILRITQRLNVCKQGNKARLLARPLPGTAASGPDLQGECPDHIQTYCYASAAHCTLHTAQFTLHTAHCQGHL